MMTGIIPCLYNSFSFTNENMIGDGGSIVCYETASLRKRPEPEAVPVAVPVPVPVPVEQFVYVPPSTSTPTDADTDTGTDTCTGTDTETDTDDHIDTPLSSIEFNPEIMTQYAYSTTGNDSILWSAYIMLYGLEKYETIENKYVESNRFKFELVAMVREKKSILKPTKLKLSGIEESLVHKLFITLETLQAIAVCKSLSVCIVQDRTYYEISSGGGNGCDTFILEKIKGKYVLYIAPHNVNMEYLAYIRANYWLMESISAPVRPLSAYKLQDLVDISQKLNLPVVNVIPGKFGSMGTEKRKTKPELYEAICKYQ